MQDLLHRIQYDHDEAAFEELYRTYVFRLFQFAFSFVRSKELSEEIVNDVFLKLWQQRSRIDQIGNLPVYLYVAVKNTASNYLRKAKVPMPEPVAHHFYLSPDPEQLLVTEELKRQIEQSIDRLPPRCKLIFKLVKEDGLSASEVAAILDLSYKTVNAQLSIALQKLGELLRPELRWHKIKL